jgi:hypothetical protein
MCPSLLSESESVTASGTIVVFSSLPSFFLSFFFFFLAPLSVSGDAGSASSCEPVPRYVFCFFDVLFFFFFFPDDFCCSVL